MSGRVSPTRGDANASFVIRPNRSLPVTGLFALFALVSALPLAIGVGFAMVGVWMVLPFALVEILFLGLLTWWFYRHIDDCELIVIEDERVRVRKRLGAREWRQDFPRYWARVRLEAARSPRYPSRLCIGSHGRYVDIAADINEHDRLNVAAQLRRALHHHG